MEVRILRSSGVIEKLAGKEIITEPLAKFEELLERELLGEDRRVRWMCGAAAAKGGVRVELKPRFFFFDVTIKIGITPTVSNDKLVVLVDIIFVLEGASDEDVILDSLLHYRDGLNGFTPD